VVTWNQFVDMIPGTINEISADKSDMDKKVRFAPVDVLPATKKSPEKPSSNKKAKTDTEKPSKKHSIEEEEKPKQDKPKKKQKSKSSKS
jgi:hypothetical protein